MPTATRPLPSRLDRYIGEIARILDRHPSMPIKIREVSALTEDLVTTDGWLDDCHRKPVQDTYARYLLHRDRLNRFVVLSLVWLPGQATPIHDHSCWGVMGILEGAIEEVGYERLDDGSRADYAELEERRGVRVTRGSSGYVLPPYEEIHRIGNPTKQTAVSVHVYGRDLDQINVYDLVTHKVSPMRIRYYNTECGSAPFVI